MTPTRSLSGGRSTGLLLVAVACAILALTFSVTIWPAATTSGKLAFFALGVATGAASAAYLAGRRARSA